MGLWGAARFALRPSPSLLPASRHHRRQRIGIVPRQRRLPRSRRRKRRHRIHQVLHLAVQQHLAIAGLDLLQVVLAARVLVAGVPVLESDAVSGANDVDAQVIAGMGEPELAGTDVVQHQDVLTTAVSDAVLPIPRPVQVGGYTDLRPAWTCCLGHKIPSNPYPSD